MDIDSVSLAPTGKRLACTATSQVTTLPLTSGGLVPKVIKLQCESTNYCYVNLGDNSTTATLNNILVQPYSPLYLNTNGATHIAYIEGSVNARLSVSAVDL